MHFNFSTGADFTSAQELLECVWEYEEQMKQQGLDDPHEFVNLCMQMKELSVDERNAILRSNAQIGSTRSTRPRVAQDRHGTSSNILPLPVPEMGNRAVAGNVGRQTTNLNPTTNGTGGSTNMNPYFENVSPSRQPIIAPDLLSMPRFPQAPVGNTSNISTTSTVTLPRMPASFSAIPRATAPRAPTPNQVPPSNFLAPRPTSYQPLPAHTARATVERVVREEEKDCTVCRAALRDAVLIQCGHVIVCTNCASKLSFCPICRQPIRGFMRTYMT